MELETCKLAWSQIKANLSTMYSFNNELYLLNPIHHKEESQYLPYSVKMYDANTALCYWSNLKHNNCIIYQKYTNGILVMQIYGNITNNLPEYSDNLLRITYQVYDNTLHKHKEEYYKFMGLRYVLHRENGPASITYYENGKIKKMMYYVNGGLTVNETHDSYIVCYKVNGNIAHKGYFQCKHDL